MDIDGSLAWFVLPVLGGTVWIIAGLFHTGHPILGGVMTAGAAWTAVRVALFVSRPRK